MHYSDVPIPASTMADMIARYLATARHPDMAPLLVSGLEDASTAIAASQGQRGVYLMYREDGSLVYIGMSLSNVGGRLDKHMSAQEQASSFWASRTPALVQTILVEHSWEAPSLEEYLVQAAQDIESKRIA